MKVGSIVEILPHPVAANPSTIYRAPIVGEKVTIREIEYFNGDILARFEEYIIGISFSGHEWGLETQYLRELLPPIENIEEYINENTVEILEPIEL